MPGRVRGVVTYKQVVLLEFKGLPTLVLLVNLLVKGRKGEKKKAEFNKAIDTWLDGESGRCWVWSRHNAALLLPPR